MSAKTIKSALGQLQDDPDHHQAWQQLREDVAADPGMNAEDLGKLLEAARKAHGARREVEAVARLLDIEVDAFRGTPREADLLAELARVFDEDLLDDARAREAYERLRELRPSDPNAIDVVERNEAKRSKWRDLVDRYAQEAHEAGDPAFRSSLLVSAAEVTYRYGRTPGVDRSSADGTSPRLSAPPSADVPSGPPERGRTSNDPISASAQNGEHEASPVERMVLLLREALRLDAKNRRAEMLLERVLRDEQRWEELTNALENFAELATQKEEKLGGWLRLARLFAKKLNAADRAAAAYERVLEMGPAHPEAANFLAEYFTSNEMWESLVALYERQLASGALRGKEELGAVVQIAMVHWRKRGKPDAAEPWFERVRKLEPANPVMLSFFRERCSAPGEASRLTLILTEAQRAMGDGPERSAIVAELAKLAEEGANAQKAIEQWRSVLRQDGGNLDARNALKRLYRVTANWNALTDLLRQELEKLPADDADARVAVLREIADIYRNYVKSDSALVAVLSQIVQLDDRDLPSVVELARVYERLQRWRDLLTMQARQAELEPERGVKAELWRSIARRWLEQFSNVQNAMEAYERLRAIDPRDREAADRLRELYTKRRSYRPLYDLLSVDAESMPAGRERRELWTEMAKLAAERLDMGAQAVALYKRILDEDPSAATVLDLLEKQAERDKDFATVADALERRAVLAADDTSRLSVLQKLGGIYSDRLHDYPGAMNAWRRVLAIQPGHAKALRVLREGLLSAGDYDGVIDLYARTNDWEGLVEVLSGAADKTSDPERKIDLSFRCAAIVTGKLNAPDRAFRSYERVLSVRPDDPRAAAALVPLYEKDEKWGRLPALYETLLGQAVTVNERLPLLQKLVDVYGDHLQDRTAAFDWARRAFEAAPDRPGGLAAFEAAARFSGQWAGFVESLGARLSVVEGAVDPGRSGKKKKRKDKENGDSARRQEARLLRGKLAEVYAREMGRVDEAVATYRSLIEEDDGDELAIQTLDRILRTADRRDDLRWLFDLRIERANTALKLELLAELAMIEEEAFAAPERAIALHRRILQIVPQHGAALRALARLLRSQGDAKGAIEAIAADRDQREGAERAAREIELAKLWVDPLRQYTEALAACQRALALVPNGPHAVEVVEELLQIPETRAQAAAILERVYDQTRAASRQAEVLEVLIATSPAHEDRMALYERLADVLEAKLNDENAAFDAVARAAGEFPNELPLWDRLSALSAKVGRAKDFVDAIVAVLPAEGATELAEHVELDLAERAATLFEEKLGDADRARPYLERMLARQPSNDRAFQRLKQIFTTREQWGELGALYERVQAATADPVRRAEMLAEVALVAEEITGDRAKAISYYERILEIDPIHEQAIRSLDSLYGAEGKWDRLAELLERRLQRAGSDGKLDLQQRLGTLLFTELGDTAGALSQLEQVLRDRPSSAHARQLVEKILDAPELRARAAIVLESVYAARDEVPELVRVLEIHLEFATEADERRDLLRRIAELRDERLRDDSGALAAFARLLPLDPEDGQARKHMLEIARRMNAHERAVAVLSETAAVAKAPIPKSEILMDVARLYQGQLNDVARAGAVYRQVLELAPHDASIALPACRALENLYAASGENVLLSEVLRIEIGLEMDASARRELQGRLGELCETVIDDPRGAIEAWRARLDDDPSDAAALSALDRLYERTRSWRELVEVLRARESHTDDRDARRGLLIRIGRTLADELTDVDEAILAYRTVVADFGADRASLAALATLYELADRWQELADTLEADLALAEAPADKMSILSRLGEVRHKRLGDVASAIDAYSKVLAIDPSHFGGRAALEAMLEDPDARREAASILRPLYEADGMQKKLLKVLEIEAEYAESISDKLSTIAAAARVAEGPLGDRELAFSYAARGLRESVAEPEMPQWIERAERLALSTGKQAELVALLRSVVAEILNGDLQLEVTLRIAEIARTRLSDPVLAKEQYARALELRADDPRALEALEALYEETGDYAALLEVVKKRADAARGDDERKQLLFKQARLSDEKLGDARAAIGVFEQIVDMGLDPAAIDALERLYVQAERWDDLVSLYERQIAAPGGSNERKAALHHALGDVLERRTREVDRAFDEYAAALAIDRGHPQTVASLEAIMSQVDHAARAAEMLEPVYLARLDWRRVMSTLEARLRASQDPDERRELLRRLAKMHEEQEENYGAALETTALLLAEDPTDEGTWAELERLARVANAEARLADIFAGELEKISSDEPATARLAKRTGELFERQGDVDRALSFYRRAHAFDPESENSTFQAIDRLLGGAGRPRERVLLYRGALDYQNDPGERVAILRSIAGLEEAELNDDAAAVETYRAALDIDDGDPHALEALSRLYRRMERWRDLAELMRRRAEQSALPEDEARFRLVLSKLLLNELGEPQSGIDELQAVVDLVPPSTGTGAEAVHALESLWGSNQHKERAIDILRPIYERADDWRRLVAINDERLAMVDDNGERIAILRENAKLWEERGGDFSKAFDAVRSAWGFDPENFDAREQLDRLAAATKRWDDLALAYEGALAKIDGRAKRELLADLAQLHDKKRDDPRRALQAWERLSALDETDLLPLEEIESFATLLSDWRTLVRVLLRKVEVVTDDESRAAVWRRIGEAKRDMLDDAEGAIDAYEQALELEPSSPSTMDNLIALYEEKNDAVRLVDLYRRRVELCGDEDETLKFQLLVDAAFRFESDLGDRREAIECLTLALAVRPTDAEVLARLDSLYVRERMWPELLDNLKRQAAAAPDDESRRALEKRIAALYAVELQDPQASLEAYRDVLKSGFDADAVAAIREIGEVHDDLRADAASALEPVLRAAGMYGELATVLELRLRAQTEPAERARTLRGLAEVYDQSGEDNAERALAALLRALTEEPEDATLHVAIEGLAARGGPRAWRRYADVLDERATGLFDSSVASDLYVRLGKISEEKLDDPVRASKAFVAAAERRGDDPDILGALDRLFTRLGETRALADVLERRFSVEAAAGVQADLMYRLAVMQIDEFGDRSHGLATLRQALERVPDHAMSRAALERLLDDDSLFDEAFDALEFVLRSLGLSEDLARLYERRVRRSRSTSDRTRARLELARVLEEKVGDPARAQRVVEAAIVEDPTSESALGELERLADRNVAWFEATQALAAGLESARDLPATTRTDLWVCLASWQRDKRQDSAQAEDAYLKALAIDPENIDVLRALEGIRRTTGRERELVHTLRMRARLEADFETKRALLREAKTLAEGIVGDPELTESVLRDLLAEDESDLSALEELTKLRGAAGDDAEVVRLLLKRAELAPDGDAAVALKHAAARALVEKLRDPARATALYEEILDAAPGDATAVEALRHLYASAGRDDEMARLLSRLVDVASTVEQRTSLRLELAKLQSDTFQSPDDAIETLRAVLDEDPTHAQAVLTLTRLYDQAGRDVELAELLKSQLDAAQARGDLAAELTLLVRLGDVQEGRLGDVTAAQETYEQVLARDPSHLEALEAVARMGEKRMDWARAANALDKLVESASDARGVSWALRLAEAREQMGDAAGAEAALERGLKLEPSNSKLRALLRARWEKAEKWAELAGLLVGDADLVQSRHSDDLAASDESRATGSLPPARRSAPPGGTPLAPPVVSPAIAEQVKLLRTAADIHLAKRKSPNDAIPLLERAADLSPHDRDLLLALCNAYDSAQNGRQAAQVLEKIIASFGNRRTKELSLYHHRLARVLTQLGDKDLALAQLDVAFKIDPGSVGVLRDLGILALEANDLERAQKTFRALLLQRLDPSAGISKAEVFCYLGEISTKQGDKAKALQMFERAIENDPALERARAKLAELRG